MQQIKLARPDGELVDSIVECGEGRSQDLRAA
jgi:hypothetical protein